MTKDPDTTLETDPTDPIAYPNTNNTTQTTDHSNVPNNENNGDTASDFDDSKHSQEEEEPTQEPTPEPTTQPQPPYVDIEVIDFDHPNHNPKHNNKKHKRNIYHDDEDSGSNHRHPQSQKSIIDNFLLFSLFFSLNHGGVVSCLSLATARLGGSLGSYQSCALYGSHTLFTLLGAASAVRRLGGAGKRALVLAMWIYCAYVGCFAIASVMADNEGLNNNEDNGGGVDNEEEGSKTRKALVIIGGVLGGIGGGFLWTAQGTYFTRVSAEYAAASEPDVYGRPTTTLEDATKRLGGNFAAIYMLGELIMRLFSSVAITTLRWEWTTVFLGYTAVSLSSALLTSVVVRYYESDDEKVSDSVRNDGFLREATSMIRILRSDKKMKYFIPFCIVFALATSFLISFINGEVLPSVLKDADSVYVGPFGSFTTVVAAVASVLFARLARLTGNRPVMALGCIAFLLTSLMFVALPDLTHWNWAGLLVVYGLQGIGRATFEGNLRAEFAVMFARDKEGAFANIVFWKGLFGAVGFLLTANLGCSKASTYCIKYQDGSLHEVLVYELVVLVCAVLAILGLYKVSRMRNFEELRARRLSASFI